MVVRGSEKGKAGSVKGGIGTVADRGEVYLRAEVGVGIAEYIPIAVVLKGAEMEQKKEKKDDGTDHPDPEIAEANKPRAALGLKPPKSSVLLLACVNSGNCSPKFALLYLLMSYKAILSCIMYRFRRVLNQTLLEQGTILCCFVH